LAAAAGEEGGAPSGGGDAEDWRAVAMRAPAVGAGEDLDDLFGAAAAGGKKKGKKK